LGGNCESVSQQSQECEVRALLRSPFSSSPLDVCVCVYVTQCVCVPVCVCWLVGYRFRRCCCVCTCRLASP
jgi:hypothetical protein